MNWKDLFKLLLPILLDRLTGGQSTALGTARADWALSLDTLLAILGAGIKEVLK